MAETTDPKTTAAPAAKKKEKPPAVEDKPFGEFIENHFIPDLQTALKDNGIGDMSLKFLETNIPIKGLESQSCWQIQGSWLNNKRQFIFYFIDGDIKGQKAWSFATNGCPHSTLESFMIDERRVSLPLMVAYVLQRLNSQKWLTLN
ncbi:hypothetical protein NIES970_01510 [[Synechococcus] sp. NIES-970]|nr:hypothetical protein NIES970_01510 [[Synechococcus] sp. NIES-970]